MKTWGSLTEDIQTQAGGVDMGVKASLFRCKVCGTKYKSLKYGTAICPGCESVYDQEYLGSLEDYLS